MLPQIEYAFQEVGILNVLNRARNIFINEYVDSFSTTIKLCGITLKEVEQTEQLTLLLNELFGKRIKIYHHLSYKGKYGGVVIKIHSYLLSDIDLLKVNENIQIKTVH